MKSLMYPAMQKFYSALSSLDKFNKEGNFFKNISSLDTFFSEFRTITLVLQKSLKHTEYWPIYGKNQKLYLGEDCKWFIEKRNEITKEQPFQLTKQIEITIYFPEQSLKISTMNFTVENDVEISMLIERFKQIFSEISPIEIFFSAEFSFFEDGNKLDIYDELTNGIRKMKDFLQAMKEEINEVSGLCNNIEKEINEFRFSILPKDIFLVNDYVYYPKKNRFDKAERIALMIGNEKKAVPRMSIDCFYSNIFQNTNNDMGENLFKKFVTMHAVQGNIEIIPAIAIVYGDYTFEIDAFNADIKTTIYRKITEASKKIIEEDIREIYWMQTYSCMPFSQNLMNMPTVERLTFAEKDVLAFMKVDFDLNEEEYIFEGEYLDDMNYIACMLKNGKKSKLNIGKNNMLPIIEAFKEKRR